jgi:hypothetical protein
MSRRPDGTVWAGFRYGPPVVPMASPTVPVWILIPFGKTSELKALGRNGYMQCHGVSVSIFGSCIHLEPIHSKGDIGRARVPVPFTAVRELRDALDTLLRHPY